MLWIIVILLIFIFLVLIGGVHLIQLIVGLFFAGVAWLLLASVGNPEAASWAVGFMILWGMATAFLSNPKEKKCPRCAEMIKWQAEVCKHCGHHQPEPERRFRPASLALANQFDLRRWKNLTLTEYAGAGVMVIGIAVVGFLALYFLLPQ